MKVQALQSFEHGGSRRRHAMFEVSDTTGQALARRGLVKIIDQQTAPIQTDRQPSRAKRAVAER